MAGEKLNLLATQEGLNRATRVLPSSPEATAQIRALILQQLAAHPELGDVGLQVEPGVPGGYYPQQDTVRLGVMDPDIVAHELGHAKNIRKTQFYGNLIRVTDQLAKANKVISLPLTMAISNMVQNQARKNEILNTLAAISNMLAAPKLTEELMATTDALRSSQDQERTARKLLPAFAAHALSMAAPAATYQLGKE